MTSFWLSSLSGPGTFASFAAFQTRDTQLCRHTASSFFKRYFQIVAKISTSLGGRATRTGACAAEDIAETKEITEDVFNTTKPRRAPGACTTGNTGVTEAIVSPALFRICEHTISLGRFFEFFFRTGVIRILVGMKPNCQAPVCALNVLIAGGAGYSQHLVIITFTHLFRLITSLVVKSKMRGSALQQASVCYASAAGVVFCVGFIIAAVSCLANRSRPFNASLIASRFCVFAAASASAKTRVAIS